MKIEEFIPAKAYSEYDFNKFTDERFNSPTLEEFR